jgi:hypothetical protein
MRQVSMACFRFRSGPLRSWYRQHAKSRPNKIVAALQPNTVDDVNPLAGRLRIEVDPRLSGNSWYLFAENAAFTHAYLNKRGWDVLAVEFRCVLDVGVGGRDYRFIYKSPGA